MNARFGRHAKCILVLDMKTRFKSQHPTHFSWHLTVKSLYLRARSEASTVDRVAGPAGTLLGLAAFALVGAFVLARLVSGSPAGS
jgi:hypothetical protein